MSVTVRVGDDRADVADLFCQRFRCETRLDSYARQFAGSGAAARTLRLAATARGPHISRGPVITI